jgi:photosystem II stability/assembly factor-like uncharacterized protein
MLNQTLLSAWSIIYTTTTSYGFHSISFPTLKTGFIVGDSVVLKTTNAGTSWTIVHKNDTMAYKKAFFTDSNTGYMVGEKGYNQYVLKTVDGGTTWTSTKIKTNRQLMDILFIDKNNGLITGRYGFDATTSNGGDTWEINPETPMLLYGNEKSFVGAIGYALGFAGSFGVGDSKTTSMIFKTTNYGKTWSELTSATVVSSSNCYHAVSFIDENTGFVWGRSVANGGDSLVSTTDGGKTWSKFKTNIDYTTYLYFTDQNTGYSISNDTVYRTINGGITWRPYQPIFKKNISHDNIWTVLFKDASTIYALTRISPDNTVILKSGSGNTNIETNNNDDYKFSVYPNPASEMLNIDAIGVASIYNMNGVKLLSVEVSGKTLIPVNNLSSGMYVVKVLGDNGKVFEAKFFKQ